MSSDNEGVVIPVDADLGAPDAEDDDDWYPADVVRAEQERKCQSCGHTPWDHDYPRSGKDNFCRAIIDGVRAYVCFCNQFIPSGDWFWDPPANVPCSGRVGVLTHEPHIIGIDMDGSDEASCKFCTAKFNLRQAKRPAHDGVEYED